MTEFPETTPPNEPPPSDRKPPRFTRRLLALAALIVAVVAGGTWWGWRFVQLQLAPLLSQELAKLFDRPVRVGDVESFSLSHVRFGESELPPTESHPSQAQIDAVDVRFNLFPLLWRRTLPLEVVLEDAEVTLPQTEDGEWVTTQLNQTGEGGPVRIQLNELRVDGGRLTVKPQPKADLQPPTKTVGKAEPVPVYPELAPPEPIVLNRFSGEVDFEEDGEEIAFNATGYHNIKGRLNAQGVFNSVENAVNLKLSAQFLSGEVVSPWIPAPLTLDGGEIFGNLNLDIATDAPEDPPVLEGNLRFSDLDMQLGGVPQPILDGSGRIRFRNQLMGLEEISASYGEDIPLEIAQGLIDFQQGYDLPIQVPPVDWQVVSETLEVEFPVAVTGELQGVLKVVGPIETPVLVGQAESTDVAIVDRLPFTDVKARFALATATSEFVIEQLTATPAEGGGEVQAAVKVQLPETANADPQIQAEFILRDASADAIARRYELPTTAPIGSLSLRGVFSSDGGEQSLIQLPAIEVAGGQARGGVVLTSDRAQVELATQSVSLNSFFPQDLVQTYNVGAFDGQLVLAGDYDAQSLDDIEALARGNLNVLGNATAVEAALRQGNWETVLTAQNLNPPASVLPPNLASLGVGTLTGNLKLSGNTAYFENPDLADLNAATSFTTTVAGNPLRLDGQLSEGLWQATLATEGLPLASFVEVPPELTLGAFAGQAQLAGTLAALDNPSPDNVEVVAQGQLAVNGGTVQLEAAAVGGQVQGQAIAQNVNVSPLLPPSQLTPALLSGQAEFAGPLNNLSPQTLTARGQVGVALDEGGAAAQFEIAEGRWQLDAEQLQIPLEPFLDAPVRLGSLVKIGEVARLSGSVMDFSPETLSGRLQVGFSFAVRPRAVERRKGTRTKTGVPEAGQDPEDLSGVALDLRLAGERWEAVANVQNAELSEFLPESPVASLAVRGQVDGAIALSGNWQDFSPSNLEIQEGALQIANLQVGDRAYDPVIAGPIVANEEGVFAQLVGQTQTDDEIRDGLAVALTPDLQPREFALQLDETAAIGRRDEDFWRLDLQNLPLAMFELQPVGDRASGTEFFRGRLTGNLNASLKADLEEPLVGGEIQVLNPEIGLTQADELRGEFLWADNTLKLDAFKLRKGESLYEFDGSATTDEDPNIAGTFKVRQGQIQDVLEALRWFDLEDIKNGLTSPTYAKAEVLNPVGVGLPDAPLLLQLRRLAEIQVLLDQQNRRRDEASPFPELAELDGTFSANIDLAGSLSQGVDLSFEALGEDWTWDNYQIHQIATQGTFEDGIWDVRDATLIASLGARSLAPFDGAGSHRSLDSPTETRLGFNGLLGAPEQSGQLQLVGLPVSILSEFVEIPPGVSIAGSLDASATLAGSLQNPRARGEVRWNDGRLNQQDVTTAQGGFQLNNARLNFGGTVLLGEPEPIRLRADIPFVLPGSTVRPDSNAFEVGVSVQNEGLAVLSALSGGNLQWLDGEGSLELIVAGEQRGEGFNYLPLSTVGRAEFVNAQFDSPQLPEPLTQVNGSIEFRDDIIAIPELVGQFRQGSVRASGELPLLTPLPVAEPLQIALDRVGLTLKGLYRGNIDGIVRVTNSALYPQLDGEVLLTNGQILIPDPTTATAVPVADTESFPVIRYEDLQLQLGRNIQIVSPPVLNFLATGELSLNGAFESPEPRGTIFLEDGQVNLFTTTFTLARGENTATFAPQFGRDPFLDVSLRAAVQETTRPRVLEPIGFDDVGTRAEIVEPAIERGAVETVRIEARVEGLASRLFENLELSSSPSRSQTEIYSLIGGGALASAGSEDSSLVVASSAVLTQIQSLLGRALGYRDFRLFPAIDPRTSVLGLGAEVGVSLTEDFSASVLTILDRDDSTRFGIRYRIDDNWLIRGSTNFDDDNRGVVEYQLRF